MMFCVPPHPASQQILATPLAEYCVCFAGIGVHTGHVTMQQHVRP